ncbi:hypothetical protein EEL49_05340 [Muribaculaceae bacterium Isolate-104 (HZI)]|nr:hypothetical protein EEL49_05340 [Muribaculaceae bacterium Isolate-104 (HZI)]
MQQDDATDALPVLKDASAGVKQGVKELQDDLGDVDVTAFYNRHYGDCRYDYCHYGDCCYAPGEEPAV